MFVYTVYAAEMTDDGFMYMNTDNKDSAILIICMFLVIIIAVIISLTRSDMTEKKDNVIIEYIKHSGDMFNIGEHFYEESEFGFVNYVIIGVESDIIKAKSTNDEIKFFNKNELINGTNLYDYVFYTDYNEKGENDLCSIESQP